MAFLIGLNTAEVFFHLNRNLDYISKRIGFLIIGPSENQDKCTIIFTAKGYSKLFPKIIALEDQAPQLQYFIPQAFIKPMQDIKEYQEKTDSPRVYGNFEIKISDLKMTLIDYNIKTKKLKIKVFMPDYENFKQFDELNSELEFIVMEIIGEIAHRKHIRRIEFAQLPHVANGLLSLVELPYFIDYLYKINSKGKIRIV